MTEDPDNYVAHLISKVATLMKPGADGWTVSGSNGDTIGKASVVFDAKRYTLLRGPDETVLVYTEREWAAFVDGARKNEFDHHTVKEN